MSDPICQLMEDIEGLCKRCYHLQKSNNDMYGMKLIFFYKIYFCFLSDSRLYQRR